MSAKSQHEIPLLLLFSEFSIDDLARLLSSNENIILRSKPQKLSQNDRLIRYNASWNIQFEGLELDMHWFEDCLDIMSYKQLFCNIGETSFQSGIAISFGSHIKNGRKNAAIISSLFRYVRLLIENSKSIAVAWNISSIISDSQYFVDVIDQFEKGGAFPILSTIDFIYDSEGMLRSSGLSYFSNQEIHYECRHLNEAESMKRMTRIAHDIAVNGAYSNSMEVDGLDGDERIFITIDEDVSIAKVRSVFKTASTNILK